MSEALAREILAAEMKDDNRRRRLLAGGPSSYVGSISPTQALRAVERALSPTVTDAMRLAGKAAWIRCIDAIPGAGGQAGIDKIDAFGEVYRAMLAASRPNQATKGDGQ